MDRHTFFFYLAVSLIVAALTTCCMTSFFARFDGIAGAGDQGGRPSNSLREHNRR